MRAGTPPARVCDIPAPGTSDARADAPSRANTHDRAHPRRSPIGAELGPHGAHVRVWAPLRRSVAVVLDDGREIELARDGEHFAGLVADLRAGARYRIRLDGEPALYPDPASRFQPEGPEGPSELIDPAFAWTDQRWGSIASDQHVLYEMHVGTFTPEGTWAAAIEQLPFLAELGVTTLEIMPIAEFAGAHNWGYDGVNPFAPQHTYGRPDDVRRFVDRAHALGLAVILDVVYNHFGPSGNTLYAFGPYKHPERVNDWGDALNFDGEHSAGVRELFIANARYWVEEFHLDGLRLDATQAIHDGSPEHLVAAVARTAREAAPHKHVFVVGENEPQDTELLRRYGLDALWNDDFHHTARVALTGVVDGYLHDYRGTPQELISAIKRGFLYQGQLYAWQRNPRGTSTRGLAPSRFVTFLENHDQVANLGFGERLSDLAHPGDLRALTALLLLTPSLPMLFQGQETGSRRPWLFFADHTGDLGKAVREGRAKFLTQFQRLATEEAQRALIDPTLVETATRCALDPAARTFDNPVAAMHRDLLRLRRTDRAFTDQRPGAVDGAVLGPQTFALRFCHPDRLLLVNLAGTFRATVLPEPLIAPPPGTGWALAWSSEDPAYGGHGTPPPMTHERLSIPGHAALLLAPDRAADIRVDPAPPSGETVPVDP